MYNLQLRWALVVDTTTGERSVRFYRIPAKYSESQTVERIQMCHPYLVVFQVGEGYCPTFIRDAFLAVGTEVAV